MIAPINPEPDDSPVNAGDSGQGNGPGGGQGEILSDPHHFRADAKMLMMAARRRWPVRKVTRRGAVERLEQALDNPDDTVAIAAVKALGYLDSLNIKREHGPETSTVNVGVNVSQTSVESLLSDPNYAAFVESRSSGDSGTVCGNGHAGKVPAPGPHPGNLHGNN